MFSKILFSLNRYSQELISIPIWKKNCCFIFFHPSSNRFFSYSLFSFSSVFCPFFPVYLIFFLLSFFYFLLFFSYFFLIYSIYSDFRVCQIHSIYLLVSLEYPLVRCVPVKRRRRGVVLSQGASRPCLLDASASLVPAATAVSLYC